VKDIFRNIPEFYFDFLAIFTPGCIGIVIIFASPAARGLDYLPTDELSLFERSLVVLLGGYVFGQALTAVSDWFLRRPVWKVFGSSAKNLLEEGCPWIRCPQPFEPNFRKVIKADLKIAGLEITSGVDVFSYFDICEQYLKRHDHEAGTLCQKRHGLVVLCRNMVFVSALAIPLYWSLGSLVRWSLAALTIIFVVRWNYHRVRRGKFLYHSLHVTVLEQNKSTENTPN